jgi:hypothetical protein
MENLLCNKYFQSQLLTLSAAPASDGEILVILQEYFSLMGAVNGVHRFPSADRSEKRCFLINFAHSADAYKAANRFRLRPYAFTGVLVELPRAG